MQTHNLHVSRFDRIVPLAAALLCATAQAQQRTPAADGSAPPAESSPAANLPRADYGPGTRPGAIAPERNVFMGAGERAPVQFGDDVPRPARVEARAGANGDELLARVEDDPFYLGFAGSKYFPPQDERLDPQLVSDAARAQLEGRTHTFGFVMFQKRMTPERAAQLEELGARVLQFHPYYCLKAALPVSALDAIAQLDFVRWVGAPRFEQKLHPALATHSVDEQGYLALYVNVYESDLCDQSTWTPAASAFRLDGSRVEFVDDDPAQPKLWQSNGPAQRALAELGVEVLQYVDEVQAFRVRALPQHVEQLVQLDCVQFVEPDAPAQLMHDESAPMIGADQARTLTGGNGSGVVSIAQCDSGIDAAHQGFQIAGWGWDFTGTTGPFNDGCEHGSHVLGTVLGNGAGSFGTSLKGVAPGLARGGSATRAYIARAFDNGCLSSGTANSTLFSVNRSAFWDGFGNTTKPVLSTNSWGSPGVGWIGTEVNARAVDSEVWNYDQVYLFAAGNQGPGAQTIGQQATAKNALTVGSVVNFYAPEGFPNSLAFDTSRGPCGDGRWKPNVVAVGRSVNSIDAGSTSGYKFLDGTSMATPHVAGLAAQISDQFAWLRYRPAGMHSLLMSSAETKGGITLDTPNDTHLDGFGAGKVSANKALLGSGDYYINNWVFDATWAGGWTFADFNVPANTKRITVCMNYVEPEASAGASQALINNWDLYIDMPSNGIDPAGNTGDFFLQQSAIDNTEIRTIENPGAGTWRFKVWPQSVNFLSIVKMGVTVAFEVNQSQSTPALDVYTFGYYLQPNQQVDVFGYASNGSGLASGASFESFSTGSPSVTVSQGTLFDGLQTTHTDNNSSGLKVALGDIPPGAARQVYWRASWPSDGVYNFGAYLDVDNATWVSDSVSFVVDGTRPTIPSIVSTSHTQGVWSNDTTIDYTWTQPADNLSGIQGYSALITSNGFPGDPGSSIVWGPITSATIPVNSSATAIYLNLRPFDNCGNGSLGFAWSAPLLVDAVAPLAPTGLSSATHPANVQQCSVNVTVNWTAAADAHSGVNGYLGVWDTSPGTIPSGSANIAAGATSFVQNIGSSTSGRYFHLRAVDRAGNWGPTAHYGPVFANAASISSYCTAKTNSLGCLPTISSLNQPSRSAGNFSVSCSNVLNQKNGLLFWGFASTAQPFQGGTLCVASPTIRTPSLASGGASSGNSCTGSYAFTFSTAYMNSVGLTPGQTVFAQWWMRDPQSPSTTGLSNALRFTVCQ